ncbi:MAG: hypothetical protein OEY99_06650 [Aigarchaeota archaeon]|nr:hypothetical protein [Aigarchaeota archaeon]
MKRKRKNPEDPLDILSIIGITVVALLLILLFKVKGGILGIVLGAVAVATLFYWLKEIRKVFREEKAYPTGEAEWLYDLIDDGEGVSLVAKVPGPAEEVEVRLHKGVLEIRGGGNFKRRVHVPKEVELQDRSYINGVLHVSLQKLRQSKSFKRLTNE